MTDDDLRAQPIPPAAGDELVIVDGKVVGDLPVAPAGVQWSTYGLDATPPPQPRGLYPGLAIAQMAVAAFLLGVLPIHAAHLVVEYAATLTGIHAVLIAGALGYRSRVFAIIAAVVSLVLSIVMLPGLLLVALMNSNPRNDDDYAVIALGLVTATLLLFAVAIMALVASFKRRSWPRALVITALAMTGAAMLAQLGTGIATLITHGIGDDEPAGFHAYWILVTLLVALPASALLVGIRNRRLKYASLAGLAFAAVAIVVPLPVGYTLTHPVALLPLIGAGVLAVLSARNLTHVQHYGDPSRRLVD